jgi:hypothetical protein
MAEAAEERLLVSVVDWGSEPGSNPEPGDQSASTVDWDSDPEVRSTESHSKPWFQGA